MEDGEWGQKGSEVTTESSPTRSTLLRLDIPSSNLPSFSNYRANEERTGYSIQSLVWQEIFIPPDHGMNQRETELEVLYFNDATMLILLQGKEIPSLIVKLRKTPFKTLLPTTTTSQ